MSDLDPAEEAAALSADLRGWLDYQARSGARSSWGTPPELPDVPITTSALPRKPPASTTPPPTPSDAGSAPRVRRGAPPPRRGPPTPPLVAPESSAPPGPPGLQALRLVSGVGSSTADVMFIGADHRDHDAIQNEPLSGPARALLNRIINNVLRMDRSDVYVANVVPSRPPREGDVRSGDLETRSSLLRHRMDAIRPVVVVALGAVATRTLLQNMEPLDQLRGRAHPLMGSVLVATHHPADLLRHPADKRKVFEDMKLVRRELENRTGRKLQPIVSPRGRPG